MVKNRVKKLSSFLMCLCMVVYFLPFSSMQKVNAVSEEKYLSGITVTATASTYVEADATFLATINSNYDSSYSTKETALEISNASHLAAFRDAVNSGKTFENKYVKLVNDIDLGGTTPTVTPSDTGTDVNGKNTFSLSIGGALSNVWKPIGINDFIPPMTSILKPFNGNFNGNGFEIQNMTVLANSSGDTNRNAGLFGYAYNNPSTSVIENVGIDENSVIIKTDVYSAGGICACGNPAIKNCYNKATIYASAGFTGGITGQNNNIIADCYNTGNIYNSGNAAGGVFCNSSSSQCNVERCYNTGDIYASSNVTTHAGGICEYTLGYIKNCYNKGSVFVSGNGMNAMNPVSAGGINAYFNPSTSLCYNVGSIYANSINDQPASAGSILASISAPVSNCYYDEDVVTVDAVENGGDQGTITTHGTSLITAQMQGSAAKTNMSGFEAAEFENSHGVTQKVWAFPEDEYPIFASIQVPASSSKQIISFEIPDQIYSSIDEESHTIEVAMPFGTDLANLTPTITLSESAMISPESGVAQNFTNPITYTVTAEDESTQNYVVTVNLEEDPYPAFDSGWINGVRVFAPRGVFQKDAQLIVDLIDSNSEDETRINDALDIDVKNMAEWLSFRKIYMINSDRIDIQPVEGAKYKLQFDVPEGWDTSEIRLFKAIGGEADREITRLPDEEYDGALRPTFENYEFSDYVFLDELTENDKEQNAIDKILTGDATLNVIIILGAIALASAGIFIFIKRRKKQSN